MRRVNSCHGQTDNSTTDIRMRALKTGIRIYIAEVGPGVSSLSVLRVEVVLLQDSQVYCKFPCRGQGRGREWDE